MRQSRSLKPIRLALTQHEVNLALLQREDGRILGAVDRKDHARDARAVGEPELHLAVHIALLVRIVALRLKE